MWETATLGADGHYDLVITRFSDILTVVAPIIVLHWNCIDFK